MEQYTIEEFNSFMKSMKRMSDVLRSKKPDFILSPIVGSVPLIDVLSIIDRHFPLDVVEYPPNSSRFLNREDLIRKWYSSFLKKEYHGKPLSLVCIDEVISGSSATKGYNEFRRSLDDFERQRGELLGRKITYETLGIGELPKGGKRNHGFIKLVNSKRAKVFETDRIITADNRDLNPIRLKQGEINSQGRQTYLPEIESMRYSQAYLALLHDAATYCGVDPEQVTPINLLKIQNSLEKHLV